MYSLDMESFAGAHCLERQTTTEPGILICGCQTSARATPGSGVCVHEAIIVAAPQAAKQKLIFFITVDLLPKVIINMAQYSLII